jgi:cell division protein FtsQ
MKINWMVIKIVLVLVIIGFLFGFSKNRNGARKLTKIDIEFLDKNDPFITLKSVNKLLIQNQDSITSIAKETLVLREMESRLLENPMIRDAEVFVTVDGVLGAKIEQRKPIGRVTSSTDYYLDDDGKKMPLSSVFTARVPLITGQSSSNFTELTTLLQKINEDEFMKNSVVGIHRHANGNIILQIRKHDFKVLFGKPSAIEKKFQNFKAFFQKTKEDKTLKSYKWVDLKFGNQVVATKK